MPLLYNVETGPNLSDDNPVLLEDADAEDNEPMTGERVVCGKVCSTAPIAPITPLKE